MRLTRLVKWQLIVFALLTVVSVVYGAITYIGIGRVTGLGTYRVVAEFGAAGGVYESGLVTYRGVTVGRVDSVDLDLANPSAPVRVTLRIDSDRKVPRDSSAHIRSQSAVGEQYVDLIPRSADGPSLEDGDVLPAAGNVTPTPTKDVLGRTMNLVAALSPQNLETTIDAVSDGFGQSGDRLARLIDSSQQLLRLAQIDLVPTTTLIGDADPLLRTGNKVAADLRSSVADLASFTDQLAMSDGRIRTLLEDAPAAADEVSTTLGELTPTLPTLLANLQTVGQVLRVNVPGLRHILTVYPAFTSGTLYSVKDFALGESPQAPLDVKLGNTLNPPPCTEGYGRTQRRDPSDMREVPVVPDQYCDVLAANPKVARGARNVPCATDLSVRTALVADCPRGLPSTWPEMLARPHSASAGDPPSPRRRTSAAASRPIPYSEKTGGFRGPDGVTYFVGTPTSTASGKGNATWQSLLIKW
ncbi:MULTISPECIES: MlaD family protein [Gordonia]|uniref:Mce family protein n=3 Tax=Gordonia TaxID=2053 RepID=L7LN02_9ACTN|nr:MULTISPECIES: MlaD family protein [Gordonia]ADG96492.1 MceF [Gordonia cholesterolivorans]AUH67641.1 MCE family protein [Gordonia sp. YC-JH1]MBY4568752.1 mammalian cell entry protein [Gordonia sihwensis]GAC61462.1 Mce family protein [Gordonia sihwensis NBRC 108236]